MLKVTLLVFSWHVLNLRIYLHGYGLLRDASEIDLAIQQRKFCVVIFPMI